MSRNLCKFFLVLFCFSFIFPAAAWAQLDSLKIISVRENIFSGKGVSVQGASPAGVLIYAGINDEANNTIYSLKVLADADGNWSVNFDQPLKSGKYYVEAKVQDSAGAWGTSVISGLVRIQGPFALIIAVFSLLVAILTAAFVIGWYLSKRAEIKRYQRILIAERDIASAYKIMKNDVQMALKKTFGGKFDEGAAGEVEFLLKKTDENLEKMNTYITKGINILSKYDIISKIDKIKKQDPV